MEIIVGGRPHQDAFPGGRCAGGTGGPHWDMFPGVRYAHGRGGTPPGHVPGGTRGNNYLFIGTLSVLCCMRLAYIFSSTGDKKCLKEHSWKISKNNVFSEKHFFPEISRMTRERKITPV